MRSNQCRQVLLPGVLMTLCLMYMSGPGALATSLWPGQPGSLYTVQRSWRLGDLVTVIVVEQAQATQTASTETAKKSGMGVEMDTMLPLQPWDRVGGELEGGDTLKATGKTVRGGTLRARVTTQVVEVESGGNLRIEGRQSIVLNGETQEIVLSGVIRSRDVQPDNTILSTSIADAQITYKGVGTLGAKQQQGVLTRFFHWLF